MRQEVRQEVRQAGRQAGEMTIKAQSGIAAAVAELEQRHAGLLEELGRVETAIRVLHDLQSPRLPLSVAPPDRRALAEASEPPAAPADVSVNEDLLVRALKKAKAPLSPGVLAEQLDVSLPTVRRLVAALEARGVVSVSGATAGRRVALAKEVP